MNQVVLMFKVMQFSIFNVHCSSDCQVENKYMSRALLRLSKQQFLAAY